MLFLANVSGSLREDVGPGELVMIRDHINFQGTNPLVGANDEEFGPRFPPMNEAYDEPLRLKLAASAETLGMKLSEGVYIAVLGPNFETPAEINAFRLLGADVVGMSTVPDVLVANHCGLRVAVVATIANLASGMTATHLSHDETVKQGGLAAKKLVELLFHFAGSLS